MKIVQALIALPLFASIASAYFNTWDGGPEFGVSYDSTSSKLKIEVYGLKKDNYFSIGMGEGMNNVDMVIF